MCVSIIVVVLINLIISHFSPRCHSFCVGGSYRAGSIGTRIRSGLHIPPGLCSSLIVLVKLFLVQFNLSETTSLSSHLG